DRTAEEAVLSPSASGSMIRERSSIGFHQRHADEVLRQQSRQLLVAPVCRNRSAAPRTREHERSTDWFFFSP
ncbi:MAG TPA: hypothetical protein VL284_14290, partial [Thermoanaerobaculia bacterium]|nr:hypothetical protein [Thermoanaerobaculia bacterium]